MKDRLVVHCPKCGVPVSVPVQVSRVFVFPGWVTVHFLPGRIEHKCSRDDKR